MFSRKHALSWIGLIVLSSVYLMGQQSIEVTATAPVPRTGQSILYGTGDDGDLRRGVEWPIPRFSDNSDGTVTDNLTALVWMKDAGCPVNHTWDGALAFCGALAAGQCGLTDQSVDGQWRLPNIRELLSLVDFGNYIPALPSGQPFTNVASDSYWSSTTARNNTGDAWMVHFWAGQDGGNPKTGSLKVWCVRDPTSVGW